MYIIGVFLATNEVEVVPELWLLDSETSVKTITECWWPPYKSNPKTSKAVLNIEEVNKSTWNKYALKVLGKYGKY